MKKIILTVIFLPAGETKLVFAGKKTFLPRKEPVFPPSGINLPTLSKDTWAWCNYGRKAAREGSNNSRQLISS